MTDALVPGARPIAARRLAAPAADRTAGRTATTARPIRRPIHLGVLLGLSASAYAVSLAGVTALQSASDLAVDAAHAPAIDAISSARDRQGVLEAAAQEARGDLGAIVERYGTTADELAAVQARLDALAAQVAALETASSGLPTKISVPSAPRLPRVSVGRAPAAAPVSHATTGASGKP